MATSFTPENYEYPQRVAEALSNPTHKSTEGVVFLTFQSRLGAENQELKIHKLFNILVTKIEQGLENGWLESSFFAAPAVQKLYDGDLGAFLLSEEDLALTSNRYAFYCWVKSSLTRERLNELYGEELFVPEGSVGPLVTLR